MPMVATYRPTLSKLSLTWNARGSDGTQVASRFAREVRASVRGASAKKNKKVTVAAAAERKVDRIARESGVGCRTLEEKKSGERRTESGERRCDGLGVCRDEVRLDVHPPQQVAWVWERASSGGPGRWRGPSKQQGKGLRTELRLEGNGRRVR